VMGVFLLSGCAELSSLLYSPPPQPVTKSRDFKRPFEEVWNCTIESLIKKGDNLSSTDKGSGLIIIKDYERNVSEYELEKLVVNAPSMVEWQSMRIEGTMLIRPLTDDSTRLVSNFKIIAKGIPYEWRNESGEKASFKEIFKGKARKVPAVFYYQEYVLESNGTLEQNYFIMIAEALLRLRDTGI
jgi:hypothetical protein